VRIEVIEGWVDKVEWPASLTRYRDFFSSYAAKITAERPANIRTIERYLLLAGDLPGLKFSTSLRPSRTQAAASTLVVDVTEKRLDANTRSDNRGTESRGPYQFLASAAINNAFGNHEGLAVSYAGAQPLRELQYVSANYRQVLTSEGLTASVNGSYSWGRPGTEALELLEFETRSTAAEAALSFPLVRARERNLTLTGLAFMSESNSDVLGEAFNTDRLRGLRLKADADMADSFQAINQFNVTFSQGLEGLGSTDNDNPLASRAAGRVDFGKVEGTVSRTQILFANVSAYVSAYGQYALTSLLSPEQCGYGGRFFGRAFDPSQLLGDHCWQALGELRYDIPPVFGGTTSAQLYNFVDYGKVYTIEPSAGTPNSSDAASIGAGVRLGLFERFNADLQAAKGIHGPRDDWRFFFSVTAHY